MTPETPPLTDVLRALADPTRRAIYERVVAGREVSVAELTKGLPVSQSAVSQHLKSLRTAGLVAERRAGRNSFYRAVPEGLDPMRGWIETQAEFWGGAFGRLKQVLKEVDQ